MARHADARGFTLIEVLVAFAITALLMLPLLRSFSTGAVSVARTDAFTEATLVAESTLARIGPAVALTDGGNLDEDKGPYHVHADIRRYASGSIAGEPTTGGPTSPVVPYEVIVTVRWREEARMRSIALQTLRVGAPEAATQSP
jgi:general secretion pathway protein I